MDFAGPPSGMISVYTPDINCLVRVVIETAGIHNRATVTMAQLGLAADIWLYAEVIEAWETALTPKTSRPVATITANTLVLTEAADGFEDGDVFIVRLSKVNIRAAEAVMSTV